MEQKLYEAATQLPDTTLEFDAIQAQIKPKVRHTRAIRRWTALAACLAIFFGGLAYWPSGGDSIVVIPGVLRVYACDLDDAEIERYELTDDKNWYQLVTHPAESATLYSPLSFQISEDYFGDREVTFKITSEYEGFFQNTSLNNGECIFLDSRELYGPFDSIYKEVGRDGDFYLDVFIYADGKLAGYGVVSFCFCDGASYVYEFSTVCYPPVDGQLQEVSEEYVLNAIEAYKTEKKEGSGASYIRQMQEMFAEAREKGE